MVVGHQADVVWHRAEIREDLGSLIEANAVAGMLLGRPRDFCRFWENFCDQIPKSAGEIRHLGLAGPNDVFERSPAGARAHEVGFLLGRVSISGLALLAGYPSCVQVSVSAVEISDSKGIITSKDWRMHILNVNPMLEVQPMV